MWIIYRLYEIKLISIRHVIFKNDTKIDLRNVETVSVSYLEMKSIEDLMIYESVNIVDSEV